MYPFSPNVARVFRKNRKSLQSSFVRLPLFSLVATTFAGCWSTPPAPVAPVANIAPVAPRAPDLRLPLTAELGWVDDTGTLHPATEIPLYPGSAFGWRLELGCEHTVEIDEELELPARGDWGTDPDMTISKNGRIAHVHSEAICLDGWIDKTWTVSAGDPPGPWKLTISVDGFRPQKFYATFVPAVAPPGSPMPQPMPGPLQPPPP